MNAVIIDRKNHSDSDAAISFGDITEWALSQVEASLKRGRERELSNNQLAAAAGMGSAPKVIDIRQHERAAERARLLSLAKKADPEVLFKQLCAGVATNRNIKANTALWLMQSIVNQACNNAAWEWARRKQESGTLAGLGYTADDAGVFNGFSGTDMEADYVVRDNREIGDSPFTRIDEAESIEGTFLEWYKSIEVQLLAMAGATTDINGAPMQAGQYSRWVESGPIGSTNLAQMITTFSEEAQTKLENSNSRQILAAGGAESNPFANY